MWKASWEEVHETLAGQLWPCSSYIWKEVVIGGLCETDTVLALVWKACTLQSHCTAARPASVGASRLSRALSLVWELPVFVSSPWSHDGLELVAQAEGGGGTQSDASIREVMCMFANYTPTTFTLPQLLGSTRLPRVRLWYGFTLSLLNER